MTSTPVSVMLHTPEQSMRATIELDTNLQQGLFKLSTALCINSSSCPVIWPMNFGPICSKVEHLYAPSCKWIIQEYNRPQPQLLTGSTVKTFQSQSITNDRSNRWMSWPFQVSWFQLPCSWHNGEYSANNGIVHGYHGRCMFVPLYIHLLLQ